MRHKKSKLKLVNVGTKSLHIGSIRDAQQLLNQFSTANPQSRRIGEEDKSPPQAESEKK